MHIAHSLSEDSIGVEELAKRVGLKRRRIAQMARNKEIPGATRPNGYQYIYPATPELLDWIEWKRRKVQQRKQRNGTSRVKLTTGVITIQGIRQEFDIWLRRVGGIDGILKMGPECSKDIATELRAIARLYWQLTKQGFTAGH